MQFAIRRERGARRWGVAACGAYGRIAHATPSRAVFFFWFDEYTLYAAEGGADCLHYVGTRYDSCCDVSFRANSIRNAEFPMGHMLSAMQCLLSHYAPALLLPVGLEPTTYGS